MEGATFNAGADNTILTECTKNLDYLSFDYKITSGEAFNIALMPNWDSYYGYFAFDSNGNLDPYNGVTLEKLENGYIRVTFDMKALTKISGTPNTALEFLYIRGNWTTATGEITNICLYWDTAEAPLSNPFVLRESLFLVSTQKLLEESFGEEDYDKE